MTKNIAAVMDIASNELRLKIAEKRANKINVIESLCYPLSLGKETFHDKKISFETVEKTSSIIKNFKKVISEYDVTNVRTIATTAIREAQNREYILEQIKVKTGLTLDVIDDNEEKTYINRLTYSILPQEFKDSSLILHLGSGNIGVFVLENSVIAHTQNIKIGVLRLSELFDEFISEPDKYSQIIREYLQTFVRTIEKNIPKYLNNLVITGSEVELISKICDATAIDEGLIIKKENFAKFYKYISTKTPEQIANDYDISFEKADLLIVATIIYNKLIKYTKATQILSPNVSLMDAVIYEMLFVNESKKLYKEYQENTIVSALAIANRFNSDIAYIGRVREFSLKIFDKLKRMYNLTDDERFLLEISAILHNIGNFISTKNHSSHSCAIIKGLDIVGLNENQTLMIALISCYHSNHSPSLNHEDYKMLTTEERVRVSKLSAILRLAVSLNRSGSKKFESIDVKLSANNLIITVSTFKDIDLEKWTFKTRASLFEDVFGIKAVLNKRSVI